MWQLLLPAVGPIIDKLVDLIPNANERAEAKEQLERDMQKALADAANQQRKINEVEAGHSSVFVASWRPCIGYICGLGLLWTFFINPILIWVYTYNGFPVSELPKIETDALFELVLAMLGLGGLRTFEKLKGVASK